MPVIVVRAMVEDGPHALLITCLPLLQNSDTTNVHPETNTTRNSALNVRAYQDSIHVA